MLRSPVPPSVGGLRPVVGARTKAISVSGPIHSTSIWAHRRAEERVPAGVPTMPKSPVAPRKAGAVTSETVRKTVSITAAPFPATEVASMEMVEIIVIAKQAHRTEWGKARA